MSSETWKVNNCELFFTPAFPNCQTEYSITSRNMLSSHSIIFSSMRNKICLQNILGGGTSQVALSSVQFSLSVVSDCLQPHESQHTRPPYPSPSPGVHSDSRPSSPWCHPAISSSVVPFSSCPQSLPASESFPMSQLFSWGGQITGASVLASFFPKES